MKGKITQTEKKILISTRGRNQEENLSKGKIHKEENTKRGTVWGKVKTGSATGKCPEKYVQKHVERGICSEGWRRYLGRDIHMGKVRRGNVRGKMSKRDGKYKRGRSREEYVQRWR